VGREKDDFDGIAIHGDIKGQKMNKKYIRQSVIEIFGSCNNADLIISAIEIFFSRHRWNCDLLHDYFVYLIEHLDMKEKQLSKEMIFNKMNQILNRKYGCRKEEIPKKYDYARVINDDDEIEIIPITRITPEDVAIANEVDLTTEEVRIVMDRKKRLSLSLKKMHGRRSDEIKKHINKKISNTLKKFYSGE
jgi:hypothetical protein